MTHFDPHHFDLVTPDGKLSSWKKIDKRTAEGIVDIQNIAPSFVGFEIDPSHVSFNIKSALAQLGVDGVGAEIELSPNHSSAKVKVLFKAYGPLAEQLIDLLQPEIYVGKLFAADERRRVRDPHYISRMFGRADRQGRPLLSLGGLHGSSDLILEKVEGRTVAYVSLLDGILKYSSQTSHFLPSLLLSLKKNGSVREWVQLHQEWIPHAIKEPHENQILLVKTLPLHVRTVFARVVDELLPPGYVHTSASILQPDTTASGDVYELFGESDRELTDIPLEFYTLEPYREHVFFSDRDQLQTCIEENKPLFDAFENAPYPKDCRAAVFVVKGTQLLNLKPSDWVVQETRQHAFPGYAQSERQALMIERYIEHQPSYPFLKKIEEGDITSQGILLTRFFPSPLLKPLLLSSQINHCLKGIYFQYPSQSSDSFFSAEDRYLLNDLQKFAIPVFWVDETTKKILQYIQKPGKDTGLFVPLPQVETFLRSTVFGIYGSNLEAGHFDVELKKLLQGILEMRQEMKHPLLGPDTPLALVTGGGPGAMEVGNRVAKELGILSCANIIDFRQKDHAVVNEQKQNPYVDAKMTYRLDKIVERQAEFNLDFPIFLMGGIGTDFEFSLEEVRRKVGMMEATPLILFGEPSYWKEKITSRFQCNLKNGTIRGSEWLSNCFYCIQTAEQGLKIYREYFEGTLPIGKHGPVYEEGFFTCPAPST